MWKRTKGFLFHLFPHHFVSQITFWLTRLNTPLKNPAIRIFIRIFNVDMSEAVHSNPEDFNCFNEFFTRSLLPGVHEIRQDPNTIVSPADGRISQLTNYQNDQVVQAKGIYFSMQQLLGNVSEYGSLHHEGKFATIYLSPKDYHRVHMPIDGRLIEMIHVPGRLFSVAPYSTEVIKSLYSRNERVVSIFQTPAGFMAVIMVGAVNVSAISMSWEGMVTPPRKKTIHRKKYSNVELKKGDELGIFNMGSTVIIAFESNNINWLSNLELQQVIRVGQSLGTLTFKH